MEDLDEKSMDELKEKAIERTDEIEITDNTIDEELIDNVIKFQKERSLTADGLVGPTTFRRI